MLARLRGAGEGSALSSLASLAVLVGFAGVLVHVLLDPVEPGPGTDRHVTLLLTLAFLGVGILLALASGPVATFLADRPVLRRRVLCAGLALLLPCLVRLGAALRFTSSWDAGMLEVWAHGMATGTLDGDHEAGLIARYPNNSLLVALLTRWFQLCELLGVHGVGAGVVLLNCAVLVVAVVLAHLTACRVAGLRAGLLLMAVLLPFVVTSPWIATAYSDTLGMVFPVLVLYLSLRLRTAASELSRGVRWFLLGVVTLVGYQIKPTVVFALAAVVVVAVLVAVPAGRSHRRGHRRRRLRRGLTAALGLLLGAVAATAVVALLVRPLDFAPSGDDQELAFPMTHWLMMGAQGTGSYSRADVQLTNSWPPEERVANGLQVYGQRVREMGPVGYLTFLADKAAWVHGDGSFFAYHEAGHASRPVPWETQDASSRAVREWLGPHGAYYDVTTALWQAAWTAVLVLLVLPLFWWRRGIFAPETTVMRLAIAALTVFLMFFEARSRYLYLYLPVYLLLATVTLLHVARAWEKRPTKLRHASASTGVPDGAGATEGTRVEPGLVPSRS